MLPPQEVEKGAIARDLLFVEAAKPASDFSAYFQLYESVLCPSSIGNRVIQVDNPVFKTHKDVLECAKRLRLEPMLTREHLASAVFPYHVSTRDKEDAIRSVLRISFMLDCSLKDKYSEGFEVDGYSPARWEANEPFVTYLQRAIPKSHNQQGSGFEIQRYKKTLRAWKLKERYKLQFRPTNNILEHLLYDPITRVVKVFHHTAYLKAHLTQSLDQPIDLDVYESLKM
jgi:hypothetical protein